MKNLQAKPFYLNDDDVNWVKSTLAGMSVDDKIGQLFCMTGYNSDEKYLSVVTRQLKAGGMMCRPMAKAELHDTVRILQQNSEIPMFIAANFETGGIGFCKDGTHIGSQMAVAATDDVSMAYRTGQVCGREGAALGANWSFAPVVDIDMNFRNPITNIRTYGANQDLITQMSCAYVKGVQENGMAATVKHFPGDGVDERDQHLVTTVNTLSCDEWDSTFGKIFKTCIDDGVMSVMAGHISLPEYSKKLNPSLRDEDILPASLAYELITTLLKEQLGFNGLVTTDATAMAGFAIPVPRCDAVPMAIAAGCDVFMFTRNQEEDFRYMKNGLESGILTPERLDEAVTKILGMKAALKLHSKKAENKLLPEIDIADQVLGCQEHLEWSHQCAEQSITLIKEQKGVLPISAAKTKRVLLYMIEGGENSFGFGAKASVAEKFARQLEAEGFAVEMFRPAQGFEGMMSSYDDFIARYDLLIYVANLATKSNQTTVRIEWANPMGANVPIYLNQIPTIFISLQNPYHLIDVPRVKTYINTYGATDTILETLIGKLTGKSAFTGISPVDAFCGKWDTRL